MEKPKQDVIGVPKWFMGTTMSAILAAAITFTFGSIKFYAQSAVMADRLQRLENKVDRLDAYLNAASGNRYTPMEAKALEARLSHALSTHETRSHEAMRALEFRVEARLDRLEREQERK